MAAWAGWMVWYLTMIAALLLAWICESEAVSADGEVIVSSRFLAGDDGWVVAGEGVVGGTNLHKVLAAEGAPKGVWHWKAPAEKYHGNLSSAFGGHIVIERGYFEVNRGAQQELSAGKDMTLESHSIGLSIGIAGLVKAGKFDMTHTVELKAPFWIRSDTGRPASDDLILKVLSDVSSWTIRGGHYLGGEHAFLRKVVLSGPPPDPLKVPAAKQAEEAVAGADQASKGSLGKEEEEETGLQRALREREKMMRSGGGAAVLIDARGGASKESAAVSVSATIAANGGSASGGGSKNDRRQQQHKAVKVQPTELKCTDDGVGGLPVSKLIEVARMSNLPLSACLSGGKQGAFAMSHDSLFYQPASGAVDKIPLAKVTSVTVDPEGHVSIVGSGGAALLQGCKMEHFDMQLLGSFFEEVLEAVSGVR